MVDELARLMASLLAVVEQARPEAVDRLAAALAELGSAITELMSTRPDDGAPATGVGAPDPPPARRPVIERITIQDDSPGQGWAR
jgi:hypothetical protein